MKQITLTVFLGLFVFAFGAARLEAATSKDGMPDLCQVDNTCLPTSTAQLLIWFSSHGYPNLLPEGGSEADRELTLVHILMIDTKASFVWGTQFERIMSGIADYVHKAGYGCNVTYHGLGSEAFSPDWLKENDDPNKGFVLLLQYVRDDANGTFSNVLNMGHAVTLISYDAESMVIEDTAHMDTESGRKIIVPTPLSHGMLIGAGENVPVDGLMLLDGSTLESPPNSRVLLIGAVRVTMYPTRNEEAHTVPPPIQTSSQPDKATNQDGGTFLQWLLSLFSGS